MPNRTRARALTSVIVAALIVIPACSGGTARRHSSAAPGDHFATPRLRTVGLNPIERENLRRGDAAWHLHSAGGGIEGYPSRTSVKAGDAVTLFVRTTAPTYRGDVFRMGWYQGAGARLLERIGPFPGDRQKPCALARRNMVTCAWRPSVTIQTSSAWVSGVYLVRLTASDGTDSFVPFVVREAVARAPILVQLSVTTWQAYNRDGGYDLYRGKDYRGADRARAVTFDRPYAWPGVGLFFVEYPAIDWLERHGYDVAYSTDIDLDQGTDALSARRVFISLGHDEYYSRAMRTALEDARARGTSLAFFGGNDLYRHIRFESSPLGPDRVEVNYKFAAEDPLLKSDPKDVTNQWRDPPVSEPEQGLLGAQYEPKQFVIGPWRPSLEPRWLFRGTGFTLGSEVANLVGWEHDSVSPRAPIPAGLVRVAHTGELLRGSTDSTFYVSGSGAGVFDAGTIWFDCGLGPGCGERDLVPHDKRVDIDPHVMPDPRLERLVANLIEAMLSRHFR